jgi:hypothetical protein
MPQISPTEFYALPLRVHTFLADVPLHDVWAELVRGRLSDFIYSIQAIGRAVLKWLWVTCRWVVGKFESIVWKSRDVELGIRKVYVEESLKNQTQTP